MPKINAGQDFGRLAPQVGGFSELGGIRQPQALGEIGRSMETAGLQAERVATMEQKQADHEAKVARDAADRARASSVLSTTRDRVGDELDSLAQGVADGSIPKSEAMKRWRERTTELIQNSTTDAPEAHRALIQQDLHGLVARFDSKVGDVVRKRDQADTRADLSTTLENLQRNAVTDYTGARTSALAALDQLGPASGMAPDQIAKAKQSWVEGASYTRAFSAVNAAKKDNRALATVEQAIQANKDLDPQRQAQLLAHIDTYRAANEAAALRAAQHAEIAAARRDREASQAWDVLSGWAMAGKAADPQAAAGLVAKLDPARLAAYKSLAAEIPARTAAAMLPLDQQQAQLDALISRRSTQGTSQELEKEIDRRQKVLDESRKDYGSDPLRAAATRGIIEQIAPLDTSSLDGMVGSLAARVGQAQTVATRTGRAVSPFLPEEAKRFSEVLSALNPQGQGRALQQLSTVLPTGMMTAIAAQVGEGGNKPLSLAMALASQATTQGRSTAELVLRGAQVAKDKSIKEETGAEIGTKASIARAVADVLPGQWRSDVIDAARLIYLAKQAEGNGISHEDSVGIAIGGKIVQHNQQRLPVLAGVDLDARLSSYPRAAIDKQAADGFVYLPGGRPMGVPEFLAGLPSAALEPLPGGRYMVLSAGGRIMGKNRRPIVLETR